IRVGCCQSDGVGSLKSCKTMKEAYAVRRTVQPSAEIQASIDRLLGKGMVDDPQKMLSELARLGARLIIQRAVEEEFAEWLGRARYERRPEGRPGKRNGFRPRHLQTGEGVARPPEIGPPGVRALSTLLNGSEERAHEEPQAQPRADRSQAQG